MARTGKPTHRPHEHGPQLIRRGRWWAADLRPWNPQKAGLALRPTLRDPNHPGWPKRGDKTEDEAEARRWAWKYVDYLNDTHKRRRAGKGPRVPRLHQAIEDYTRHRERTQELNTVQADGTALNHLKAHVGNPYADAITPEMLQPWFDARLDEDYKPSTLERYRLSLSAFFDWLGSYNPAREIALATSDERDAKAWDDDELADLREAADKVSPEHRRYLELGIATGGRYSELLALEWSDLKRDPPSVRFARQAVNEGTRRTKGLKGDRNRTALVLPSWWPWHVEGAQGRIVRVKRPLVKVLEKAGMDEPEILNHAMRHTYARICRERLHIPIAVLKVYLGHKSERTTERYYGWMGKDVALDYGVRAAYGE